MAMDSYTLIYWSKRKPRGKAHWAKPRGTRFKIPKILSIETNRTHLTINTTLKTQCPPYVIQVELGQKPPQYSKDDPQTAEQLCQRNSHTVKKVLGPTTDFPTWGSGKGTVIPHGIWVWRPAGFDYRISTGLGKQPFHESKRGKWKICLKTQHSKNEDHGIQSHHFLANIWENNRNSDRFYFLGSKITAGGDCSHEIQRLSLLRRKAMTNLDSV